MRVSPLRKLQQLAEASLASYGPPEAGILVAETFGELELEYAAIRKACILLDQPQRALIEITGKDRLEFLNRMVTQELKDLVPFHAKSTFWLNRKGRIDADLRLIELGSRTLVDVDTLATQRTIDGLHAFVITEDVSLRDVSESTHRMALHGPTAAALLRTVSEPSDGPSVADLATGFVSVVRIRGHEVVVDRDDTTGEPGFELTMPAGAAVEVFQSLVEAGQVHNDANGDDPASRFRLRPSGWHAYNIARIEAGRPLYNIDFGPDSLPHETGLVGARVSFTKGCYLGQEVVARMQSRGHSKKMLMGIKCESVLVPVEEGVALPRQPVTASRVWDASDPDGDAIGAVTSSTLSPMLGSSPICFAMIKHDKAKPGLAVLVETDAPRIKGATQSRLSFWDRAE